MVVSEKQLPLEQLTCARLTSEGISGGTWRCLPRRRFTRKPCALTSGPECAFVFLEAGSGGWRTFQAQQGQERRQAAWLHYPARGGGESPDQGGALVQGCCQEVDGLHREPSGRRRSRQRKEGAAREVKKRRFGGRRRRRRRRWISLCPTWVPTSVESRPLPGALSFHMLLSRAARIHHFAHGPGYRLEVGALSFRAFLLHVSQRLFKSRSRRCLRAWWRGLAPFGPL